MDKEVFLQQILDDSNQMVQVSDLDTFSMIYANKPAREYACGKDLPLEGSKCYKYMMGLDEQCPFCPLRQTEGKSSDQTIVDNGKEVFEVKTKIIDLKGRKTFVEYAWDITKTYRAENVYKEQVSALMMSIRDAQMVFHMDVTGNKLIGRAGVSYKVENVPLGTDMDTLLRLVSAYIVDKSEKVIFFDRFNLDELKKEYNLGKAQISQDMDVYYNDGSIRPSRVISRLFMNPANNSLECILYGIDITQELNLYRELESAYREQENQMKKIKVLNKKLKTALDDFKEADYDRRRDFLTGLRNRQDLFELLQDVLSDKHDNIQSMFIMDIDSFKALNDKYGHVYGDECLQKIGKALIEYSKDNDINVYRYGGEEILVVCFDDKDASVTASELVKLISGLNLKREDSPVGVVTVSVGYTTDNSRYEKMIDKADKAMYWAKEHGKNQAMCFEEME